MIKSVTSKSMTAIDAADAAGLVASLATFLTSSVSETKAESNHLPALAKGPLAHRTVGRTTSKPINLILEGPAIRRAPFALSPYDSARRRSEGRARSDPI